MEEFQHLRLHLVGCKIFLGVKYFQERKIFSSIWLYSKKCFGKYFLVFGCILENTIENTFSTCCSHFLLVAHIFSASKQIYNIISQSTNPKKKNSSNLVKLREEGRERGDWVRSRGEIARRRRDRVALESIFA